MRVSIAGSAVLVAIGLFAPAASATGSQDLDATFGNEGVVLEEGNFGALPVVAPDGRILLVGGDEGGNESTIVVRRYSSSGTLDTTYGSGGRTDIDLFFQYASMNAATLDHQGRLVMAGRGFYGGYTWLVIRLNQDGSVDQSFGSGGVTEFLPAGSPGGYDIVNSVDVDSEGRIVVGGICCTYQMAVARLLPTGDLDPSFGSGGIAIHPRDVIPPYGGMVDIDSSDRVVGAMSIQVRSEPSPWGPLQILGTEAFRLTEDGEIDNTYGSGGQTVVEFNEADTIEGVAIDQSDRLLVMGSVAGELHVGRFLKNGGHDASYGDDGAFRISPDQFANGDGIYYPLDFSDYPGNRAVVAATSYTSDSEVDLLVLRLTEKGGLDPAFSGEGIARLDPIGGPDMSEIEAGGVDIGFDGKIVAAFEVTTRPASNYNDATSYFGLARYLATSTGPIEPIAEPGQPGDQPPGDDPLPGGDGTFVDDDGHIFEGDIEWLAAEGVTKGCNPPINDRYCPDDYVTRGQMAAFMVRALGYTDDGGGGNLFIDDNGHTFEHDIDKLGTAGVTKGCNPPINDRYCPDDYVTRGQMAAFLHRALGS